MCTTGIVCQSEFYFLTSLGLMPRIDILGIPGIREYVHDVPFLYLFA